MSNFGELKHKIILSKSVEIHIREGAMDGKCLYISKFIRTARYQGYAKGGFMVPNERRQEFAQAIANEA